MNHKAQNSIPKLSSEFKEVESTRNLQTEGHMFLSEDEFTSSVAHKSKPQSDLRLKLKNFTPNMEETILRVTRTPIASKHPYRFLNLLVALSYLLNFITLTILCLKFEYSNNAVRKRKYM